MVKNTLVLSIIASLLCVSVIPSSVSIDVKQISKPTSSGNTLYVGGSGPGNYSKIQDAINAADNGDTVYVYSDSSPYLEEIQIKKSIHLLGEHRNTTVIDGGDDNYRTIHISADRVDVKGFTILGSIIIEANFTNILNNLICSNKYCIIIQPLMINISLYNNTIIGNTLISNSSCIIIWFSHYSLITNNSIYSRREEGVGILLDGDHSIVYGNNIKEGDTGIFLIGINTSVYVNTVSNSNIGLFLAGFTDHKCSMNNIYLNVIKSCNRGIFLFGANNNEILENNFLDNSLNAFFINSSNQWKRNYWSSPRIFPKIIFGRIGKNFLIPWINIDWHPASEPYDVGV